MKQHTHIGKRLNEKTLGGVIDMNMSRQDAKLFKEFKANKLLEAKAGKSAKQKSKATTHEKMVSDKLIQEALDEKIAKIPKKSCFYTGKFSQKHLSENGNTCVSLHKKKGKVSKQWYNADNGTLVPTKRAKKRNEDE